MGKSKKKRFTGKDCAYCGCNAESVDHIPPRNLFASPQSKDLIAVPCCRKCNNGFSKDDEYFRMVMAVREDTFEHPDVQKIYPAVHRSFDKPEKKAFFRALVKSTKVVDRYTLGGIYLGKAPTFNVDMNRVRAVCQRITKGLFYHERGIRLPDDFLAVAYWSDDFIPDPSEIGVRLRSLTSYVLSKPEKTIGNKVFTYWHSFMDEFEEPHNNLSAWFLQFYGKVHFLCMTYPSLLDNSGNSGTLRERV
jgi:hypothetical protein